MSSRLPYGVVAAAGGLLLCAGCASGRVSRLDALEARAVVADPRTVVSTELAHWADLPLDEAVERIRPELMRPTFRDEPVAVYIDRQRSSFEELHSLLAGTVIRVQLLTTAEAESEYGAFIGQPVLAVSLVHSTGA